MKIVLTKGSLSGLAFMAIGGGAFIVAQNYPVGTLQRMGPGFFPSLVGASIALLGLAVIVADIMRGGESGTVASWEIRPAVSILGAVVAFALLISKAGLVLSVLALVGISSTARPGYRFPEVATLSVVLCSIVTILFVYTLKIPLRLLP